MSNFDRRHGQRRDGTGGAMMTTTDIVDNAVGADHTTRGGGVKAATWLKR
jgi:hypothetical protein